MGTQSKVREIDSENQISKTKWLFSLCWIQYTVIYWGSVILNRLPFFVYITPLIFPALLVFTLFVWLGGTNYSISIGNFVVLIAAALFWIVSQLIHPEYNVYFNENLERCFLAFLMVYVGKSVFRDGVNEEYFSLLVKLSKLGVIFTALYFVYGAFAGRMSEDEYMTISYRMLPSTLCLAVAFLKNKKIGNTVWFVATALLQLFMGTRGAVLAIVILIVLYFLLFEKKRNLFIAIICAAVIIFFDSAFGLIELFLLLIASIASSFNMSTRIIDAIISSNIADDNGREEIYDFTIEQIKNNIWSGEGIFADRYILQHFPGESPYVHNVLIELWSNFGLIPSILIVGILLFITFRFLLNKNYSVYARFLLLISFSAVATQLMFTGSYLTDAPFWLFIGILWGIHHYREDIIDAI